MISKENCSDLLERLPTMYYKTSQDKLNEDKLFDFTRLIVVFPLGLTSFGLIKIEGGGVFWKRYFTVIGDNIE